MSSSSSSSSSADSAALLTEFAGACAPTHDGAPPPPAAVIKVLSKRERELVAHGYRCFYLHARGLVPFASKGTPQGEAARPVSDCHEGLPFCARWRLYNRQFWSNIFCGVRSESAWLDWIADAAVSPTETRDKLLRRA